MKTSARVLIVDDDPSLLALLRLALAKEGVEVSTAERGAECLGVGEE
jgi:two-component system response regulator GlrR